MIYEDWQEACEIRDAMQRETGGCYVVSGPVEIGAAEIETAQRLAERPVGPSAEVVPFPAPGGSSDPAPPARRDRAADALALLAEQGITRPTLRQIWLAVRATE